MGAGVQKELRKSLIDGKPGPLGKESEYQAIVGKLMWLFKTRHDIRFATGLLARSLLSAGDDHIVRAKRVIKYLAGNPDRPMIIDGGIPMTVSAASDSDWAENFQTCKSTSGFYVKVGSTTVTCVSQIQRKIADSSAMAETLALAELSKHVQSAVGMLEDIGLTVPRPVQVLNDNQAVVTQSRTLVNHSASKHYRVPQSIIRELVDKKFWDIIAVPSEDNPADVLTKPLLVSKFQQHNSVLMG